MSTVSRRLAALLLCSLASPSLAQTPPAAPPKVAAAAPPERVDRIRSRYTKFEYRVPMRDGVKLFTSVYVPVDASPVKRYPILLVRTPYSVGPYGADRYPKRLGPTDDFEKEGYIFVFQDVRGRHMSEGEFVNVRPHNPKKRGAKETDESSDTYDTIDWLVKRVAHNNGRVGMWGISYPGFYASAGAIDSHPALKAVSPQAPIGDWFWDDMHRHGAFNLALAFGFFSGFGKPRPAPTASEDFSRFDYGTPDGYQFFLDLGPLGNADTKYFKGDVAFWKDVVAHPNYDAFWKERNILPHLKNIKAAMLVVGGWYDTEDLYGPLRTYAAIEKQNPGTANTLIMGPWSHGGWIRTEGSELGDAQFGFRTAETYQGLAEAFFKHHLKGGGAPEVPEALVFETGANRWRQFDTWPPKGLRGTKLYFQPKGGLSMQTPTGKGTTESFAEYVSDPAKPVPYTQELTTGWSKNYMTEDQRFAASRPDVLVFQTEPLTQDLTLAGPLEAELWVSTTGSDADWVVKLIDVNPGVLPGQKANDDDEKGAKNRGGQQTLVRGEPFRGRFRESYSEPKAFKPGEVTKVRFTINDVLHTFQRGHRVMIQVQSSWFPFIDRNPQTYVPNIYEAKETDFTRSFHRVYHSSAHPSFIEVGVLPALDAQGG
ncbi:CocE/NonD family hydrolase [Myxococcus stipitatus DSM 14675]|uniref:CocE/NonD family hydrolase n=1 Tax=Myxococcus stipitatus (strain DSM 14675 / JCM 12634 / Mx s8) TaxID=1278073 RepID=L7UBZ3_MYXSD|nr:CocE/NonD family hydrolase [Myxococcus stipitatus]AGC45405.1 CocE/NonD family hydrolase [Myxococcus stipitatus DSM 14675]